MRLRDGEYTEDRDGSAELVHRAVVAAGGPMFPPKSWYEDPQFDRPTPLTITADGQIKGHIAPWNASHIGLPSGTRPPRSQTDYAYFRTGEVQTAEGVDVPVGQLTLAGGHAPINASAQAAVEHYDNTASAIADVAAGEDEHGIWISGGVRPGVTDEQIRALRASAPSGDWRPIEVDPGRKSLELVAVCQVNTPGFPLARAMVASGEIVALVAAGASDMYSKQTIEHVVAAELDRINQRIEDQDAVIASLRAEKKPAKGKKPPFAQKDSETDDSKPEDADSVDVESESDNEAPDVDKERRAKLRGNFDKLRKGAVKK